MPELGMWHYKARIYSPTLGRFLQTDPVGYDDQVNLYAYVGNDPVNRNDPSGEAGIVAAAPLLCAGPQAAACGIIAGGVVVAGCLATQSCRDAAAGALRNLRDRFRESGGKGLFNENQAEKDEQDRKASNAGREVITQGQRPAAGETQIDNRGRGRQVGDVIKDAAKAAGVEPEQTKGGQPTVRFPDGTRAAGYPNSNLGRDC